MDAAKALEARRNPDGGFGSVARSGSEPEPTALAAIAMTDDEAAMWLEGLQAEDGSVGVLAGNVFRDLTALAALAMHDPRSAADAITWVERARARAEPATEALPHDPTLRGWSWTSGTFGWVEPTAWGVLAIRMLGAQGDALEDGVAVLRDRECVGGGWNYGNRVVLGEDLPPFVQPTGLALLSVHGLEDVIVTRGLGRLAALWREEASGLLSLAVTTATLRVYRHPESDDALGMLGDRLAELDLSRVDTVALAWSVIATGRGFERLSVG